MRTILVLFVPLTFHPFLAVDEWKYDVVHLKSGQVVQGLLLAEEPERIHFQRVLRRPGARTVTREVVFEPTDVDRIERLDAADRKFLRKKLLLLDEYGEQEKLRAQAVSFAHKPWPTVAEQALHYTGKHFTLTTNAREDIVRLAVVRLEEIFRAYVANFGVRKHPQERIKITLYRSVEDYRRTLARRGQELLNLAYYDAPRHEIHVACDLERLEAELEKVRHKHRDKLQELAEYESKLRKHYDGKPPASSLAQLRGVRQQLQSLNHDNDAALERLRGQFFATLYHEAFHAYLGTYVYPDEEASVPRWLNEGLAQIFENALVETGELRFGHLDPARLAAAQTAVRKKQLVPLRTLLQSTLSDFRAGHSADGWSSDRFFLTSWALTYYLIFEKQLLGSAALHQYILTPAEGTEKVQLFQRLVGKPLEDAEADFHAYLLQLRQDGSVRGKP